MRVLLDCDGVLGDFASEVIRFCNLYAREPCAPEWTIEDAVDYSILESLGLGHLQEDLDSHLAATHYCINMPVLPGAIEFVERLQYLDHEVVIVTRQHMGVPNWCDERMKWLWRHFGIHADDVIFARVKDRIKGDVLIDDEPDNVFGFKERGILFDQPWNRDVTGAYRAESYQEVVARLRWLSDT